MREHAETLVRDIALSSVSDPTSAVHWDSSGQPREMGGPSDAHARATRVCFHRLDLPHRRVLRASQVDGLGKHDIAKQLALPVNEVEALLLEAVDRLDRAVAKELEGGSP